MNLLIVAILTFLINIPFGYWRANVRKKSFQWILAIHIPVPFVVLLRIYSNIGFELFTYPIVIASYFFAQFAGVKFFNYRKKLQLLTSSCLIMDLYRANKSN
ncbi:Hypothetical protein IALB_2857 [Ignavibacterium album JCM 16511]|uniref:Uncharacterized protein n=1 Tax=Ignavibacterium album (strain DSM 19864 / JCM 16511 / NBRC 101810 / Mat9-16) TaxID=945713 RepID=I0ANK3_IGNAJ|nr:hypothetical protein [Ignavibacterium album]AFH50560.1 Hypothetical protein IALB_2857 [Ignavibacterium album JCM 16511]